MSGWPDQQRIARETRAEMERTDYKVKVALLAVSSLTIVFLIWAALAENVLARWRLLRGDYQQILDAEAEDDFGRNIASAFRLEVDQNVIPDLGRTDRCITCHTGIADPRMRDAEQPFTAHPGRYVQIHEPTKFGCTVCHEGQGRATSADDAHGRVPFWDYPMHEKPYMKSGCTKCHTTERLFGPERLVDRADDEPGLSVSTRRLDRGWRLMETGGCLGCHALDGKGGDLGPDISSVGDKTPHEFPFAKLEHAEMGDVSHWLEQHFLAPGRVSPGSLMPVAAHTQEDAEALTAVMLSLRSRRPGPAYGEEGDAGAQRVLSAGQLYGLYCSACHGRDGSGNAVPEISTPSLSNDDVLAVADDAYLRAIIASGRRGTYMPGWSEKKGGLSATEIDRIVTHVRAWQQPAARPVDVRASVGNAEVGGRYYRGLCASCHGDRGEGGIGNRLSSPSFLSLADDRFLAEAIINGRPGTAMSSWKRLPTQAVADLVAHIRTWQAEPPSYDEVRAVIRSRPQRELRRDGQLLYGLHCASCHGPNGDGGLGNNLRTADLLGVVDDRFLYRNIVEGRPTTAMPAWWHLAAEQIAAIISHLRSWQPATKPRLALPKHQGDYVAGEAHYRVACVQCHGERGSGAVGPQLANEVLLSTASDRQLFHWVANGRAGTAMKGFLPQAQGPASLTPDQIVDVIAYLRYVAKGGDIPLRRIGAGDPMVGARLFEGTCSSCHGAVGAGMWGPQLNNPSFLRAASDGFLAGTIVLGREGTPMRSMMQGHQGLGQLEPDEVRDVIAYMRLWEGERRQPTWTSGVELSEQAISNGKELFAGYCSGCHGPAGLGTQDGPKYYAPALNNQDFLDAASDGFLLATIARGRRGTPMRPFGKGAGGIVSLAPEQISDIVSFIRSWQRGVPPVERHATAGGTSP